MNRIAGVVVVAVVAGLSAATSHTPDAQSTAAGKAAGWTMPRTP
jgi:hypothetical protein